jgi:hypothetical protein
MSFIIHGFDLRNDFDAYKKVINDFITDKIKSEERQPTKVELLRCKKLDGERPEFNDPHHKNQINFIHPVVKV